MSAQRINEKHSSWMLPVVLVNICLEVEFDVLVYMKCSSTNALGQPWCMVLHIMVFTRFSSKLARSTPAHVTNITFY